MTGRVLLEAGPSLRGWSHQDIAGRCPQAWAFSHLLADPAPKAPADPLIKGALVHVGMCHFWQDRLDGGDPHRWSPTAAVEALADEEDTNLAQQGVPGARWWRQFVPLAQAVLAAYIQADPHRHLTPLAVEHHVELWVDHGEDGHARVVPPPPDADTRRALAAAGEHADLVSRGPPYLSTFRADLLAYDAGRRVSVIDWKTGYRLDAAKIRGFRAAGQFLQYQRWGMEAYGAAWGGAWVGFINLGDMRKGNDPSFDGFPVVSSPEAVEQFPQAVWDRAERLRTLLASGRDPRRWPRAYSESGPCSDRYGPCTHFERCVGRG